MGDCHQCLVDSEHAAGLTLYQVFCKPTIHFTHIKYKIIKVFIQVLCMKTTVMIHLTSKRGFIRTNRPATDTAIRT